jgi:hypothetical protein
MAINPISVLNTVVANASFDDIELKLSALKLIDTLNKELIEFEFSDDADDCATELRKLAYDAEFEIKPEEITDEVSDDDDIEFEVSHDDDDDDE